MGVIPEGAAVRSAGARWAVGSIAVAVLAADQVSKSLVLAAHPVGVVGSGWITVRLVRNTGASGGLASGYPVLVTLAALAITVLAAVFALRAHGRAVAVCLAAVLGGAMGNLADRVFRAPGLGRGGVVDWIHLAGRGGSMDVADVAIQLGVLGVIIAILAGERVRVRKTRKAPEARRAGPMPAAAAASGSPYQAEVQRHRSVTGPAPGSAARRDQTIRQALARTRRTAGRRRPSR